MELTHANLVANAHQTQGAVGFTADDVVVGVAPFFHAIGQNLILPCSLRAGATVVTMPRFDFAGFLELIQRYRSPARWSCRRSCSPWPVTRWSTTTTCRRCAGSAAGRRRSAPRWSSAAPTGWAARSPGVRHDRRVGHLRHRPAGRAPAGSAGRLLGGTEARIVDPDGGGDLGPGRTGELWLRGPQVMRGYRNQPEATARTIDPDGWLRTGDLCYLDADGYLFVVDRLKELIKYKGAQVAPAELEQLLCAHPAVADAAVVPRPDPEAGEVPVAYVARRAEVGGEELQAWVAERVAPYKRVRDVRFVDQVPRSPTGKLLRRTLVEAERADAGRVPVEVRSPGAGRPRREAVGVAGVDHQLGVTPQANARSQPPSCQSSWPGAWASVSIATWQPASTASRSRRLGGSWRSGRELTSTATPCSAQAANTASGSNSLSGGPGRRRCGRCSGRGRRCGGWPRRRPSAGSSRGRACAAWSGRWPRPRRAGRAARRSGRGAVLEDVDLDPGEDAEGRQLLVEPGDLVELGPQPLRAEAVGDRQPG